MFGLLKNKIADFVSSIVKKASGDEKKEEAGKKTEKDIDKAEKTSVQIPKPEAEILKTKPSDTSFEKEKVEIKEKKIEIKAEVQKVVSPARAESEKKLEEKPRFEAKPEEKKLVVEKPKEAVEKRKTGGWNPQGGRSPTYGLEKAAKGEARKEASVSFISRIKSVFSDEIELTEGEIGGLFDALELSLLESDVAYDVASSMVSEIRGRLIGKRVKKGRIDEEVKAAIREAVRDVMVTGKEFDLLERVKSAGKPAKILFIGPNGAGKTTTIGKVASMLKENGMACVISASDTFRAAAIEQMQVHADRLGVRMIRGPYGADPASVAFDALQFAKAHGIDVVLIDSAGRQETNRNLMDELGKIVRVIKPDLKIYVGESFGGSPVIGQIGEFNRRIGIDGVILTKLDCDSKGGNVISIARETSVPVIYFGTGQGYSDLQPFSPDLVLENIFE